VRWKNVLLTMLNFRVSRRWPKVMRRLIRWGVTRQLPPDYEIDTHFRPRYEPWDQRVCLVPGGDLFRAIRAGDATVVTDEIEEFTERGLRLKSGGELEADLVVTATGLNLLALGGIALAVDGEEVDVPQRITYKGLMVSGVPNLAIAMGYTNASWTLKCELICEYVCRLLNHMAAHGYAQATPRPGPEVQPIESFLDLTSGYILRSIDQFPKQGGEAPWRIHQNYLRDIAMMRRGDIEEGMQFSRPVAVRPVERRAA
jgi:cation diffusion facilitator CzcD-associated flavoprotein CzcO